MRQAQFIALSAILAVSLSCQKKKKNGSTAGDGVSLPDQVRTVQSGSGGGSGGSVTADTTPPTLTFLAMPSGLMSNELNPLVRGDTSEESTVTLYYDSACAQPKSSALAHTVFNSTGIQLTGTVAANGLTEVFGKAIDKAGNASNCKSLVIYKHESAIPMVTSVSSTTTDGAYPAATAISVTVTFSENVTVSGVPQLALKTGASDTVIDYVSGTGTSTLTFNYVVGNSDNSVDLDYSSVAALTLNGGSIVDADGNNAVLTLPPVGGYSSIAGQKDIVVDTTVPTITYASISPATIGNTRTPTLTLSLSEAASVQLFSDGACTVVASASANLSGGAGKTISTFSLAQNTATTLYGKATDPAGHESTCTSLVTYAHDGVAPMITNFVKKLGQSNLTNSLPIMFNVTFSEAINPMTFTAGDITNAGTATAVFWTVTDSGDHTNFTLSVSASGSGTIQPRLLAASISDPAGNTNLAAATSADTVGFSDNPLTVTINQAAGQGDPTNTLPINFTIIYSAVISPWTFTAADIINAGTASGITWSLVTTDNKVWTLVASSVGSVGTVIPVISANSVQDIFGNNNAASTASDNTVTYDITAPTLTYSSISPANPGSSLTPTVVGTASEASIVTLYYDSACVTVKSASTSNAVFASPGITLTGPVPADTATMIYGQAVDLAGNASSCTALVTYTNDSTPPSVVNVSSSTSNGSYKAGQSIAILVTFSEAVTVSGTPRLTLETGANDAIVNYSSGSGTTTLTFTYTVGSGDTSADLDYQSTSALSLNGGSIKDAVGNAAVLTLPALGSAGSLASNKSLVIDTTLPTISFVSISPSSPGTSQTPQVTVILSEAVSDLRLYSNAVCSAGISSSASAPAGSNTITTISLTANATTSIYAKAMDNAANFSTCVLLTSYRHDGIYPSVSSVSSTVSDGTYGVGAQIPITVTFSEAVAVTGVPQITLETGSSDAVVKYASGSGTSVLTFQYMVAPWNASSDLDYANTSALALNGGTIKDLAGNSATLTLPSLGSANSIAGQKAILIDTAQYGSGCSAYGLRSPTSFTAQVEFDASLVFSVNVQSNYNICTRLAYDSNCTYRCSVRVSKNGSRYLNLIKEGQNLTAAPSGSGSYDFEIGFDLKSSGTPNTQLITRISGVSAGTQKVAGTLGSSSVSGFDKVATTSNTGLTSNPILTNVAITSSSNSTLTPAVKMDVNSSSAATSASVVLFSDNVCSQAISASTNFASGTNKTMQTNSLSSSTGYSIYGQAYSGTLMTGCISFGSYTTP